MDMQSAMLHAFDKVWAIPEPKGSVTLEGRNPLDDPSFDYDDEYPNDGYDQWCTEEEWWYLNIPELIGESYEHLPQRQGRLASFLAHGENACFASPEDKRDGRQSHGKHGRLCGRKLYMHRHIRAARRNTHRQMDTLWLREMCDVMPSHMSVENFLDAHDEFSGIDTAEGMFVMSEAHQNCHGFSNTDPMDEYWCRGESLYDMVNDPYWDDPWGVEHYELNYPEEEEWFDPFDDGIDYSDPLLQGPSAEEWAIMEAEERREEEAAEKAAEAFEASFEHIPACNQIGRKAQRMHASVAV